MGVMEKRGWKKFEWKSHEEQLHVLREFGEEKAKEMLATMWRIRAFEEKAKNLYALGQVHGTMHLSIGQEGSAVGASKAMRSGYDYLLNHHRGHGHSISWTGNVEKTMAEFLGKETGFCRGRGGSMHIADVESNNLGANGIVAGGIPIAAGVGLSIKMRETDQVCIVMFGDGAANEGAFHESLNMASIWDLPVIYYLENNQYAMSMAVDDAFNIDYIAQRSCAYNIDGITVDGNDVLAVYAVVRAAHQRAVAGEGPTLVEALTYRWEGHSKSDRQAYRTRDELKEWQALDPIPRFEALLKEAGMLAGEEAEQIEAESYEEIEEAVTFAENSPEPDFVALEEDVYA